MKYIIFFAIGIILGLLIGIKIGVDFRSSVELQAQAPMSPALIEVIAVLNDIKKGEAIRIGDVGKIQMLPSDIPEGYISSDTPRSEFLGKRTRIELKRFDVLTSSALEHPEERREQL